MVSQSRVQQLPSVVQEAEEERRETGGRPRGCLIVFMVYIFSLKFGCEKGSRFGHQRC